MSNDTPTVYAETAKETRRLIRKANVVFVACRISNDDVEDIETTKAAALRSIKDYPDSAPVFSHLYTGEEFTMCFIGA